MDEQGYIKKLDQIAEQYHEADLPDMFIEEICQEHTFGWLFDQLEGKEQVLELGYGDGIISQALANRGVPFEIIEGSPNVIATATKRLSGIPITQTLFESFNPKKRYDCILALHVLEHVDEPVKLLRQMRSWLSDAGSIVIIVPNKNSLHRQLAVNMGLQKELDDFSARDVAVGHQRVYCHDSLQHDVEAAGFEVFVKTGFFLKTLPNSMMLDHSEALIHALNDISPHIPVELLANIGMVIK